MTSLGLIELVAVFGIVLALAIYDLVKLRRERRKDDQTGED